MQSTPLSTPLSGAKPNEAKAPFGDAKITSSAGNKNSKIIVAEMEVAETKRQLRGRKVEKLDKAEMWANGASSAAKSKSGRCFEERAKMHEKKTY